MNNQGQEARDKRQGARDWRRMDNFSSAITLLIKDEAAGRPRHETLLFLGDTPGYLLQDAGFPALQLAITGKVVSKACFDHGISTTFLKRLPEIVARPRSLYRPADQALVDSVVIMTVEKKAGIPIIIPLRRNQRVGRAAQYNLVSSVYAKEGPDPDAKWRTGGLLIKSY